MSSGTEEFVVDGNLADWLGRHGMHARTGDRARLALVSGPADADPAYRDKLWGAFTRSAESVAPDLASRATQIVRAEPGTCS